MKILIGTISAFLFSFYSQANKSCNKSTEEYNTWKISLTNNLGTFEIKLPKHLDTLFNWTQYSDCGDPCAHSDYRIQSKSNPIFKDDGFYYFPLQDSVEQFTIKHQKITYGITDSIATFSPIDTSAFMIQHLKNFIKNKAFENPTDKYILDTVIAIEKFNFIIVAFAGQNKKQKTNAQGLIAMTCFLGNIYEFYFENRQKNKLSLVNDFINKSLYALKTLRLSAEMNK